MCEVHRARSEQEAALLAASPARRFSLVRVPLHRGWSTDPNGGFSLRAPHFDLAIKGAGGAGRSLHFARIDQPILLLAPAAPPSGSSSHIEAEGFLDRSESGNLILHSKSALLVRPWGRESLLDPLAWNRHLAELLAQCVVDRRSSRGAALAGALLLGRSSDLPDDIIEAYQHGGTYHLLVFSGLQLAVAAGLISASLTGLELPLITDLALLVFAIFVTRFIGNDPSVSRSAAMLALLSGSRLLRRPTPIENLYFLSAMLRLICVPDDLSRPGFLLTYGATGGLILVARPLIREFRIKSRIGQTAVFATTAELTTIPLTIQFFHRFAVGSSMVTLILMPPLFIMSMLSAAAGAASILTAQDLASALLTAIDHLNDLAMYVNGVIAATRLAGVAVSASPGLVVAVYAAVVLITAVARRSVARLAPLLLLIPLASGSINALRLRTVPTPQVEMLDVGQGDSILLRSGASAILIDGGGRAGNTQFGDRILVPKLLERGVRHLSAVVLSHPHPDHCGGLPAVLAELAVDELWIARRHLHSGCAAAMFAAIGDRPVRVRFLDKMAREQIAGIDVQIFTSSSRFKRAPENNSSSVLRAAIDGRSILLTGDIEREAEGRLLDDHLAGLDTDILKVAHHGSRTSSTGDFLAAAHPRVAIISCGRHNFFGHPHLEVLARLRELHTRVLRTDVDGDICITFRQHHLFITTQIDSLR